MKKITIIVVNWNCGHLTKIAVNPYLNYKSDKIICEVIVVDNASNDNSLEILRELPVKLIENRENLGFGKACNQAYLNSKADYILLLNPDTKSDITTLEGLVEFLENDKNYAITGPQQWYEDGKIMKSCGRFPSFKSAIFEVLALSKIFPNIFKSAPIMFDFDHLQSRDVDQIMGSYMLIRKAVIDKIGFMDDDYFVYGEDLDLSKRVANAGFKSYFNCRYKIIHKGGGSGDKVTSIRLLYSILSRNIYWKKHLKKSSYIVLTFFSLTAEPLLRVIASPFSLFSICSTYFKYVKRLINL